MTKFAFRAALVAAVLLSIPAQAAPKAEIKGALVLGGVDAKLTHVRARRMVLDDKGSRGYAVLLSAKLAEGDFSSWRTADPQERGNFLHLILDEKGEVWVFDLGHTAAKNKRFGGVTEIKKVTFAVQSDQLTARVRTNGEQSFLDDRFTVDITFEVPLEGK
jgi:hypothetical protein